MKELIDSEFDELVIISRIFPKGFTKREVKNIVFTTNPRTISKTALAIDFTENGKRKRELVGEKIICLTTDLPDIKKPNDENGTRDRTSFEEWDEILENYLRENEVKVLLDGRKEETDFKADNSKELAKLRAKRKVEKFDFQKEVVLPDEIEKDETFLEGSTTQKLVNSYERNSAARQKCLEKFGFTCAACDLDMEQKYGEIAKKFIHVHHTVPLSKIGEEYEIDPTNDLIPLCPNCHSIVHRKEPPYTVEELRKIIAENDG